MIAEEERIKAVQFAEWLMNKQPTFVGYRVYGQNSRYQSTLWNTVSNSEPMTMDELWWKYKREEEG